MARSEIERARDLYGVCSHYPAEILNFDGRETRRAFDLRLPTKSLRLRYVTLPREHSGRPPAKTTISGPH
jgi:hypothetical protein